MKKVAVLTINDNNNYGNRLQNYAVQEILKKYEVEPENVRNLNICIGVFLKRIIKRILNLNNQRYKEKRLKNFRKFNKNIKFSKYIILNKKVPKKINKKYITFFTGSDQVWNPNFGRMSNIDFLTFAPKEKRNSISASFGISEIPENLKEFYRNNLLQMNNISVREDRGKEIVEELTGRTDVEVLIDPTMLLTAEEWDRVSKKPEHIRIPKKYILNYFLGELSKNRKNEIERIAKENNCEVINILDEKDPFFTSGPSEFLYLEKNAFLICTDSFHSCVFAIIYNRPFIVFKRDDNTVSMNSRLETLLSKFKLIERYNKDNRISKEMLNHDYKETYKILEEEKQKSYDFIKKIFEKK